MANDGVKNNFPFYKLVMRTTSPKNNYATEMLAKLKENN